MELEEQWKDISGFPGYQISNYGRIYSERTRCMLRFSMNDSNTLKVNLMLHGEIQTRSVRVMVAETFLGFEKSIENDTPININGDVHDNRVMNLAWRPRWFAWKYTRQFHEPIPPEYGIPIFNEKTHETHESVIDAGIHNGELWEYIYNSILTGRPVYPSGSTYAFLH